MKYLEVEVEVEGALKQAERRVTSDRASDERQSKWRDRVERWATKRAMWPIGDLRSNLVSDLQCPNPDAMCFGLELELCSLTDLRCNDARSVCWLVLQCWLRCSVDVFVFRFALLISDLVIWGFRFSDLQCILGFGFFFFLNLRVFLILLEGVPHFFFKGKQINKKLIIIYIFFSSQGVPGNTLTPSWCRHCK